MRLSGQLEFATVEAIRTALVRQKVIFFRGRDAEALKRYREVFVSTRYARYIYLHGRCVVRYSALFDGGMLRRRRFAIAEPRRDREPRLPE